MVVNRDGEDFLGVVLADDVFIEPLTDLCGDGSGGRLGKGSVELGLLLVRKFLVQDGGAHLDTLVADIDAGAGDELLDLRVALATEGAHGEIGRAGHR